MRTSTTDLKRLLNARRILLTWFAKNGRVFFWRKVERDPYVVLVAELMLQQTQTSRVDEFLPKFLQRFPSVKHLANAKTAEVIKAWQGLGYNRRALILQKAAQYISLEHNNIFPSDEKTLLTLPGVGPYTARAIQAFAFRKDVSVVDVNIERVISRLTKKMKSAADVLPVNDIHIINERILPKGNSVKWHEALMDFGATICKKNPKCDVCNVTKYCASYSTLAKSTEKAASTKPNEKQYFGAPKRIWRGKVLKIVTNSQRATAKSIVSTLITYATDSKEFASFINIVISELIKDGFIKIQRGIISLR